MDSITLKIVCIIQNNEREADAGLVHTFEHSRHSDTNEFIKTYLYCFSDSKFCTKFGYYNNEKYLLITKDNVIAKSTILQTDKWEILFVCDSLGIQDYPSFIFTPETLLMYHRQPDINGDTINRIQINGTILPIRKGKKGEHEPLNKGYNRLLALTEAWKNKSEGFNIQKYDKARKNLIDWFGLNDKLNAALEFLHQSLGGTPADTCILTRNGLFDLGKTVNGKTLQHCIDELENKTSESYKKALRDVRDVLLKEAGATGEN